MQAPRSGDVANGEDRPNRVHWPPILYALTLVAAWGLERIMPLPPSPSWPVLRNIGWGLLVSGLAVGAAGLLEFYRQDTPFDPTARAKALATTGIYRYSRNPMYFGALLAFAGLGLALAWTWLLLLVPLLWQALVRLAITREEAHLARRFGEDYDEYRARVRRWL